jgi:hypothetical protein
MTKRVNLAQPRVGARVGLKTNIISTDFVQLRDLQGLSTANPL